MATTYTVQTPPHAGATLTPVTPSASGDVLPCGGGLALLLVQTATTAATVTLPLPASDGQAVTARTYTVPGTAGAAVLIPLPSSVYGPTVSPTWTTPSTIASFVVSTGS